MIKMKMAPTEQLSSTGCSLEELCSPETPGQALPSHGKSASIVGQPCQSCLYWRITPLSHSGLASHYQLWELLHSC